MVVVPVVVDVSTLRLLSPLSRVGVVGRGCRRVVVAAVVVVDVLILQLSICRRRGCRRVVVAADRRRRRLVEVAAKAAAVEVSPSVSPFKLSKCRRRSIVVLVIAVVADVLWVQLWSVIVDAVLMVVVVGDRAGVVFEAVAVEAGPRQ